MLGRGGGAVAVSANGLSGLNGVVGSGVLTASAVTAAGTGGVLDAKGLKISISMELEKKAGVAYSSTSRGPLVACLAKGAEISVYFRRNPFGRIVYRDMSSSSHFL